MLRHWPGEWEDAPNPRAVHEAGLLQLCTDKARSLIQWSPVWQFEEAVARTAGWYLQAENTPDPESLRALTRSQIDAYCRRAREQRQVWTRHEPMALPALTETRTDAAGAELKEKPAVWTAD